MPDAVDAVLLGLERVQRVQEVRDTETLVRPASEVDDERVEVGPVVREEGCELDDGVRDLGDVALRGRFVAFFGDRSVLDLQRL